MPDPRELEHRLALLRRRWEDDKSSLAFLPLAEEYRRLGRLAEALSVLEAGLAANPTYRSAQVALGRCRLDLGDIAGAIGSFEYVLRQDPTQLVANKLLIEAYLRAHRPAAALERLDLYALLNERDPELAALRRRIAEMAPAGENTTRSVEALAEEPALPAVESGQADAETAPPVGAVPLHGGSAWTGISWEEPAPALAPYMAAPKAPSVPGAEPAAAPAAAPAPETARGLVAPSGDGDIFALPRTAPASDLSSLVTVRAPAGGEPFGGLGSPRDRRRYLEALSLGGVFGRPATSRVADEIEALPEIAAVPPAAAAHATVAAPAAFDVQPVSPPLEHPAPPVVPVQAPPPAAATPMRSADATTRTAPQPPILGAASVEEAAPTATLGELYLRQGHYADAERIFRQILEREPSNLAALAGLEEVRSRRRMAEARTGAGGISGRKVSALRSYLERLKRGAQRHVS